MRDLAPVLARGEDGATTVAATSHLAALAGIRVFATGGLGGVHRGARDTFDESADLGTLARVGICVVCAGVKSILDIPATLERLETLNVTVLGYRTDTLPRLLPDLVRPAAHVARGDAAGGRGGAAARARRSARPARSWWPTRSTSRWTPRCTTACCAKGSRRRREQGVSGRDVTPFLLERFHRLSERRVAARQRAARAAQRGAGGGDRGGMIVVVGEVMLDVVAFHDAPLAVASDTPARISLRPGGAGANTAAWLARAGAEVALIAQVGDDDAATAALAGLDGVDLRVGVDAHLPTGTCIVLVSPGGERTMLPDPGREHRAAGRRAQQRPLRRGQRPARLRLLADAARLAHAPRWLAMDKARDAGMPVSVDPASAALLLDDPAFLDRARPVDLLLPNEDEFAALGGDLPGVKEFVIKRGRDGASWSDGRRTITDQGRRRSTT